MRSSDSNDRDTKKVLTKKLVRRSPRLLEKDTTISGILVLLQTDLLPWRDAMTLGSTCRFAHETWVETRDVHLLPLLKVLQRLAGGHPEDKHEEEEEDKEEILHTYILDKNYSNFSIARKCEDMVASIKFMVINMKYKCHPYFCLEDPSNRLENSQCDPFDPEWYHGLGHESEFKFFQKFHRRGTVALNIAIFDFALDAMKRGGDYHFNDVFMGMEDAELGWGSYYGVRIWEHISAMFPFRDQDLAKHMRQLYPSASDLELLGPILSKELLLIEPFFHFLPPLSDSDDNEEHDITLFKNLPTPLEPLTEEIIIDNGMGAWLGDPNHRPQLILIRILLA